MKFILSTFISLLGIVTSLLAQNSDPQKEESARKIIESADYIVEAAVVPDTYEAYFAPDSTESYGSFLINISKVFRGNIRPGTAEVIYSGANISYYKNGILHHREVFDGGAPDVAVSGKYIIFADDAIFPSSSTIKKQAVTNSGIKLIVNSHIEYPSGSHELFLGPALMQKFKTEKEVYQYLRSFQNVNISDIEIQNASETNSFLKQKEPAEQNPALQPLSKREAAERSIQDKISHYRSLLKQYEIRKQYRNEDHPEKVAEAKKQLAYWENQLLKLKKKK